MLLRLVVGGGEAREDIADAGEGILEACYLVVEVGGGLHDLFHILVLAIVLPEVVGELESHQQVARRDDDDLLLISIATQLRLLLHGGDVTGLVRDEHQHKTDGIIHQLAVVFLCQFVDVLANAQGVCFHQSVSVGIIVSCQGIGVSREGNLGVDHHASALRESDDDIRTEVLAILILGVLLDEELLILAQTTVFENRLQDHLSPVALQLAVALERLGQVGGIGTNLRGLLLEGGDGLLLFLLEELHRSLESALQFLLVYFVLGLAVFHRFLEVGELLLDRFQKLVHLQAVVLLERRLLGSELLSGSLLLLGSHSLHLLSQSLHLLRPLTVVLLSHLSGVLTLACHLFLEVLHLCCMMASLVHEDDFLVVFESLLLVLNLQLNLLYLFLQLLILRNFHLIVGEQLSFLFASTLRCK